jgi:hypothetical protein
MTATDKPASYYLGPSLLALSAMLAAVNWYLQPARAGFWTSSIVVLGCMMLVFFLAHRRSENEARRRAADAIRQAIVFAGLMMAIPLSMKLATALGAVHDADLARRTTMILMGAFVAFTGNAMPKTLTPLSALQCDAAKVQAFQRVAGWTWMLTGVAFAISWLVLPLDLAKPVSVVLLMSGMLVVALQLIRLRRTRVAH